MRKNIYQFRSWEGVDVDNEISLFEYGFLYNPKPKKNYCNILYGVKWCGEEYTHFQYSSVNWKELISESWIDWEGVCSFCGQDRESFDTFSCSNLHTLIQYYGTENVLGTCYEMGFEINKRK